MSKPNGARGKRGPQGLPGRTGRRGPVGVGKTGAKGRKGATGARGTRGDAGPAGALAGSEHTEILIIERRIEDLYELLTVQTKRTAEMQGQLDEEHAKLKKLTGASKQPRHGNQA
jgi:Collagen triple helix repeat (20 copies)